MRLLKTTLSPAGRIETAEFYGDLPPYAILSHTWGDEEVLYADLIHADTTTLACKKGYRKIQLTLEQAVKDNIGYAWVDTCCINKESSAELSEAINAMFSWYKTARVCYAFLEDVRFTRFAQEENRQFRSSRWFTRGWTLQELLAPTHMLFFTCDWAVLGTRRVLAKRIREVTGIGEEYLQGTSLNTASIAQRMSWASQRVTTRVEDAAYCLLGIFDVNMPMLYGEGSKAFIRLQEEIMRSSDDQSLFAWQQESPSDKMIAPMQRHGLLADAPSAFARAGSIVPHASPQVALVRGAKSKSTYVPRVQGHTTHSMTNKGLYIELSVVGDTDNGDLVAVLNCTDESKIGYVAVKLAPTTESADHFARVDIAQLYYQNRPALTKRSMYFRQRKTIRLAAAPVHYVRYRGCGVRPSDDSGKPAIFQELGRKTVGAYADVTGAQGPWLRNDVIAIPKGQRLLSACIMIQPDTGKAAKLDFVLLIGSDDSWRLAFDVRPRWKASKTEAEASPVWLAGSSIQQTDIDVDNGQYNALSEMPAQMQFDFDPRPASHVWALSNAYVKIDCETEGAPATYGPKGTGEATSISVWVTPRTDAKQPSATHTALRSSELLRKLRGGP